MRILLLGPDSVSDHVRLAIYAPQIGFSPELGLVAGVLLLHAPAEDVFWLLVAVTSRFTPGLYDRDQDGLRETAFVGGSPAFVKIYRAYRV